MKLLVIVLPILNMIKVIEVFKSIQGESTYIGSPCTFVRLSGCNLTCTYCDTTYAFQGGTKMAIPEILREVQTYKCSLVEITGGEPLLQKSTPSLVQELITHDYTVLIETNGTFDLSVLPQECIKIMDIKCPGSGNHTSFLFKNIDHLQLRDQCKLVISSKEDFLWALDIIHAYSLHQRATVIFSPNTKKVDLQTLAKWILETNAPVRLGLQLHKIIWGEDVRGV